MSEPQNAAHSARFIYDQSNGDVTKAYYAQLVALGPAGVLARDLFRAHKTSGRAKLYRGHTIGDAYAKKAWAIGLLVDELLVHGPALGITFGWKEDRQTIINRQQGGFIIYIDLPTGQCSFHMQERGKGPDYAGEWDGMPLSDVRILRWCDILMGCPPEDLGLLRERERKEPLRGKVMNAGHRAKKKEGRQRRLDALAAEIQRLAGEEAKYLDRLATLHQAELFA